MSSTPIDQAVVEATEAVEATWRAAWADKVMTPVEAVELDGQLRRLVRVTTEVAATVRICRSALHAGISSNWVERKTREHVQDTAALEVEVVEIKEVIVAQMR